MPSFSSINESYAFTDIDILKECSAFETSVSVDLDVQLNILEGHKPH